MNRCMGKLKGWEMNRWLEDERVSEWEEGGQSGSPPLHRQGESLKTELVSFFAHSQRLCMTCSVQSLDKAKKLPPLFTL